MVPEKPGSLLIGLPERYRNIMKKPEGSVPGFLHFTIGIEKPRHQNAPKEAVEGNSLEDMSHHIHPGKDAFVKSEAKFRRYGEYQGSHKGKKLNFPDILSSQKYQGQGPSQKRHDDVLTENLEGSKPHSRDIAGRENRFKNDGAEGEKKEGVVKQGDPPGGKPTVPA